MERVAKLVPKHLMPYQVVIVFAVILLVIWGVFALINYGVRDWTVSWTGECAVGDWNKKGQVGFMVDCGDKGSLEVYDSDIVRSYLKNPGPLVCRQYLTDNLTCEARPGGEEKR